VSAAAAAPDCSAEQAALDQARADKRIVKQKLRKAQRALRKAKRALRAAKAADRAGKVTRLKMKVARLKRRVQRLRHRLQVRRAAVVSAQAALDTCLEDDDPSPDSPVQVLCDGGIPQAVCDALAGLLGGTPDGVSLDALCTAVPETQPICDAYAGGTPDPVTLLAVVTDVLITLGLEGLLLGLPLPLP
jgi:hypothetical protein